MKRIIQSGVLAVLLGLPLLAYSTAGCGDEEECLGDGENCTQDYVESEYGDGRTCCSGMACESGPNSGVLICQ